MIRFLYISLLLLFYHHANAKPLSLIGLDKLTFNDLNSITSINLDSLDFTIQEINIIVDELYKSDLIFDINFIDDNQSFTIEIIENKVIQNIFINRNEWIEDDLILNSINSKKNNFVSKSNITKDIKLINSLYKSKGFNLVNTSSKIEYFSDNRVNIIFDVHEGVQSKLNYIKFEGNKSYSDKFLKSQINSKSLNFYNIFRSGSNLNQEIFEFDKNKIINFYKDQGYFDIKVSYQLENNFLGDYSLVFFLEEGQRYNIQGLNFSATLENSSYIQSHKVNFQKEIEKNKGFYDKELVLSFLEKVNRSLLSNNINNFYVDYEIIFYQNFIEIYFTDIAQDPKIINKIEISGNSITKDKTIRSKILVEPGDYYNKYLIDQSVNNLRKFRFIKDIEYEFKNQNKKSDLFLSIDEETKTGNLLFAGTYNTDTQLGFTFGIEDKNFNGSGNMVDANFNINSENLKFDVNYTEFPLFNPNISNTYSIFNQDDDLTNSFGFKSSKTGFGYKINFANSSQVKYGLGFSYQNTKGHSPKNNSSSAINDNIGDYQNILFSFNLNKDTTNDFFNPTDGHVNRLSFTISPTEISDDPFYKITFINKNYFKFKSSKNFVFINNNLGYSESLKSKLKTINSFSLGGNNFKGFDFRGIGPVSDNIYLGGNRFITSTLGYGSSFIFDDKDNINIKLFLTSGSIWDSDYVSDNDFKLRTSAGLSFDIITAVGPISLSYAVPLSKEDNDKQRQFSFTIGTTF